MERNELVAYQAGLDLAASRSLTLTDFDGLDIHRDVTHTPDVVRALKSTDPETFRAWVGRGILDYVAENG